MRKGKKRKNKGLKISLIIGICLLLVVIIMWGLGIFAKSPKIQNFILLSVDDLRADRLGCYGNDRDVSPTMDKLADQGTQFLNAYICWPYTPPSHASMLTSVYPSVFDIPVDPNIESLASILHRHGYRTAAFTGGGWMQARFGILNGFEECDETGEKLVRLRQKIKTWLRKNRDEKFFLFLHTYRVHRPFVAPERYLKEFADPFYSGPVKNTAESTTGFMDAANAGEIQVTPEDLRRIFDIYDGQVKGIDRFVSKLVHTLSSLELVNKTMLIITSDHGEQLFEYKKFGHLSHVNPFADVTTRVPLIVYCPGLRHKAKITQFVEVLDIPPSILDAVGIKPPKTFQGQSFFPILSGKSRFFHKKKREVYFRNFRFVGVRTDKLKLIINLESGETNLYDLLRDPGEKENIIEEFPASKVNALMMKIKAFEDKNEALRRKLGIFKIQVAQDLLSEPATFDGNSVFLVSFDDNMYAYRIKDSKHVSQVEENGFQFGDGKYGQALFLEAEKAINFPLQGPLMSDSGSMEFWLRINNETPEDVKFLQINLAGKETSMSIRAGIVGDFGKKDRKKISFELKRLHQKNGEKNIHFSSAFSLNIWHHVLIAWEPEDIFLLVDGVLVGREMIYSGNFFKQVTTDNIEVSGNNCLLDAFRISDWSRLHHPAQERKKKLDPELIKKLRALGYIN